MFYTDAVRMDKSMCTHDDYGTTEICSDIATSVDIDTLICTKFSSKMDGEQLADETPFCFPVGFCNQDFTTTKHGDTFDISIKCPP
mmetsp:Transcript_4176/g.6211  ORF Transcript_4176/g.6211 Transcript_4176/m.6211 type:complete len:86 (-) Transcript_4176:175-432(-)